MPNDYSPELIELTDRMLTVEADKRPTVKELLQSNVMQLQQQKYDLSLLQ
jgi:hypothetical protein